MPAFTPLARLVCEILLEIEVELSAKSLALTLEADTAEIQLALQQLIDAALVGASFTDGRKRYGLLNSSASLPTAQSEDHVPSCEIARCFQLRAVGKEIESISAIFALTDRFLSNSSAIAASTCMALGIRHLTKFDEQNQPGNTVETFIKLVLRAADISMYLSRYHREVGELTLRAEAAALELGDRATAALCELIEACLENMNAECSAPRLRLLRIKCNRALRELEDVEVTQQVHYFRGMFNFWEGNYQQVLEAFHEATIHQQIWQGRFQAEMFPLYTSSAAVYLGHCHQAVGILEAARRAADLEQNFFKTLWWEAQLAMVLLYMDRREEALELIDRVINRADEESETKILLWALRGLAYYHYRNRHIISAHKALTTAMHTAMRNGIRRPIYSYPWLFDMLQAFLDEELPPIPGLDLEEELARALHGPNMQLQAAALRTKATRDFASGKAHKECLAGLRQSLKFFESVGTPLEAARTQIQMALMLEKSGNSAQAAILREDATQILQYYEQQDSPAPHIVSVPLPQRYKDTKNHTPEGRIRKTAQPEAFSFSSSAAEATPASSATILPENPIENCRLALDSITPWENVQQFLHQMVYIASCDLGAERAALFHRTQAGDFTLKASCNISEAELKTGSIKKRLAEILPADTSEPKLTWNDQGAFLFLPLFLDETNFWLLYLESAYAVKTLKTLSPATLGELAALFGRRLHRALHHQPVPPAHQLETAKATPYQDSPETLYHGSPVMRQIISRSRQVAMTDAPVLILGETGVGKELLARYLHDCSGKTGQFIPVHPASIPDTLFESEFFGHEKGAFTGAHKQKIGLVEMADAGTLFIDEVADIPMSTQVKLLRVFQEHRFLRVGGLIEIKSSFRLVGATNKNLWKEVQAGRFREDLYYRMSVVPITLPPLRDRKEDIPILARLFLDRFARRYHRTLPISIPEEMEELLAYPWPGNVRELKSLIERAVILYRGGAMQYGLESSPSSELSPPPKAIQVCTESLIGDVPSLKELELRYVRHILDMTRGRITGPKGALKILGVKRSTFYAKYMKDCQQDSPFKQ
ncbi:MAG: sigma-54 dependent transcriptional regulator [Desulfovibrio sp.]|uniref:sigma-54 interaction domain-containing protein n=1 Tax=Desulfovibrio sp. TaxID=885 RepID=UPI0039E4845C